MNVMDELERRDFVTLSYQRLGNTMLQTLLTFSDVYVEIWSVYHASYAPSFESFEDPEEDY